MRNSIGITGQDERTVNRKRKSSLAGAADGSLLSPAQRVGAGGDKHVKGIFLMWTWNLGPVPEFVGCPTKLGE